MADEHVAPRCASSGGTYDELYAFLEDQLLATTDPSVERYINSLQTIHDEGIAAILFYGSCLYQKTRTATSFHDFYVLTAEPWRFYHSRWHAALNHLLPPNVYYAAPSTEETEAGPCSADPLRYKYCVLTMRQFQRETCPEAHDIHHLGRFSKRFALIYYREPRIARSVIAGACQAMLTLVPLSLSLLPEIFTLEEFILQQLRLSYLGEQRVVEPDKVQQIYLASRDYYQQVYEQILDLTHERWGIPQKRPHGRYQQPSPTMAMRKRTEDFLRRSRFRGVLRWPKYMLTVDNWLQYILDKLERHQGVRLELTARERRFPLIFGWPRFFELRRKGVVGWSQQAGVLNKSFKQQR